MDRYWYIVAERMIVEDIDREEQNNIYQPALDWDLIRLEEERSSIPIELWDVASYSHEEELNKR